MTSRAISSLHPWLLPLFAALLLQDVRAMSWEACGDPRTTVVGVTLTPDPVPAGGTMEFVIKGVGDDTIHTGQLTISVAYRGFHVFSKSADLCKDGACPIGKGDFTLTSAEPLPSIAPPGPYTVRMQATGGPNNEELLCLDINFQVVWAAAGEKTTLGSLLGRLQAGLS